jgi:hypothetical protein
MNKAHAKINHRSHKAHAPAKRRRLHKVEMFPETHAAYESVGDKFFDSLGKGILDLRSAFKRVMSRFF